MGRAGARYCHRVTGKELHRPSSERRRQLSLGDSISFLLSQAGAHSSRLWTERLRSIGLDSREVMLFWNVAMAEGRSQRQLAEALAIPSSRVVALVDSLEEQGWLERRTNPRDRRARALYLTGRGRKMLQRILAVAADQETHLSKGLSSQERRALVGLLSKLAKAQRLTPRVHPDF